MGSIATLIIRLVAVLAVIALIALAFLYYQGKRKPVGNPQYVAMGSSFAAGIGLGKRPAGSPLVCMRSVNGYPQQLARMRGLSLVDVSCSGATASHVLSGGQVFLGPQLDALGQDTELVTMTVGGNDVRYVGDLSFMAGRKSKSPIGWLMRRFWTGPLTPEQRDFLDLHGTLVAILQQIRRRSPKAKVVVLSYPLVLPPDDPCPKLQLSADEAGMMGQVGENLADVTRSAAQDGGAIFIDMQHLGAKHHACSPEPWVNGWNDTAGAQFHPTLEGSKAMVKAIAQALDDPAATAS
ncbi:MAG: SGNH/GDSL hydrolase family protein [Novosphingobium sp.]|nr:SGNH/GDSL hydrolase family protein [Novosphingobium sp.]